MEPQMTYEQPQVTYLTAPSGMEQHYQAVEQPSYLQPQSYAYSQGYQMPSTTYESNLQPVSSMVAFPQNPMMLPSAASMVATPQFQFYAQDPGDGQHAGDSAGRVMQTTPTPPPQEPPVKTSSSKVTSKKTTSSKKKKTGCC
mmetsp:Transcript_11687/g.26827  ORF Transcript_11687/g.26827 Transcript_11687/m.26827 type:complete len:142 (+) Transcript_11687:1-426(+)